MKITKRQLRKIIREAHFGRFTGRAAPLDVPMRDSGPIPKDQLRKLAGIFIDDMGMSPQEVLAKPEFVEQGITDLRQLDEATADDPIRQIDGDSFPPEMLKARKRAKAAPGVFKDTIIMSPTGDSVLVGGMETDVEYDLGARLYELSGVVLPTELEDNLHSMVTKQMADGYVEIPVSWSPNAGWKF